MLKCLEIEGLLVQASSASSRRRSTKPKLKVWTREISDALQQLRNLNKKIAAMNNFNINETQLLQERKNLKKEFRRACRVVVAKRTEKDKNDIMASRTYDSKTFHNLVKKQRNKGNNFISDLYVGNEKYTGTQGILDGFQQHFEQLALSKEDVNFDAEFHKLNKYEVSIITEIVKNNNIPNVTMNELEKAIKSINKGKAAERAKFTKG